MIKQMNDDNVTQEKIMQIAAKQEALYSKALDDILKNKNKFIDKSRVYDSEIFALEKIIKLNKRLGNKYATIRDEVLVKSYRLLNAQNTMVRSILRALNNMSFEEFQVYMSDMFVKNQEHNAEITNIDYEAILQIDEPSRTLKQAKENIRDYYALLELNGDTLKYLSLFEKKMYRLNKYSNYNLINPVISINNTAIAQQINSVIRPYGFDVVKIIFILLVFAIIYLIRKYLYKEIEAYIFDIESLKKYSKDILNSVRKPIEFIIILINIEVTLYIYNDFAGVGTFDKFFTISYIVLLTYIVYKIVNVISSIKIHEIDTVDKKIKSEIINVGIKIINFIIMVIGLLVILHFAGANLTTVLSGLGIGGFAVALAAKDSLANFFGTLSILLSDVFSQGDWIAVNGHEGTVVEIGLRVTTLRTFDNAIIAIPNSILANQNVKNWDKRSLGRRIKMSIGIKYNSKRENIKNAIEEIRHMIDKHPGIATVNTEYDYSHHKSAKLVSKDDEMGIKRNLLVYLDEFSGSSINILIYCFSKSVNWAEWLETKEDVMYNIMEILERNSLEFAFPSMSIYKENEPSQTS
ncbi:mechanosensitive ion channel family protein [Sulfurimonas gotlandica GD1]|uniref:Mechanosensitive ion channel family protein n=2 Tax=Sulfurimonas TaxID=202746 RepID=B6BKM5_SULGG|nr:mechanosensitive ion channel family protein [Sulfurimonas gotlandica GD1]EHP29082.1 mechanosensitive ion channel family protein [Sulfurimonas gotlandica GD1]